MNKRKEYIGENISQMRYNTWRFNVATKINQRIMNAKRYMNHSVYRDPTNYFDATDIRIFMSTTDEFCILCFPERIKTKLWNRNPLRESLPKIHCRSSVYSVDRFKANEKP